MIFEIQDVGFDDGEAISGVSIGAFFEDKFQKSLYPGISFEKQLAGVIGRWPNNYGSLSNLYKKVIDKETGRIVSYSKWSFANTESIRPLRKVVGMSNYNSHWHWGYVPTISRPPRKLYSGTAINPGRPE
jgi:hypothetical protein